MYLFIQLISSYITKDTVNSYEYMLWNGKLLVIGVEVELQDQGVISATMRLMARKIK